MRTRAYAGGISADSSALGFAAAGSARIERWLYLGAEARYLRTYGGLALGSLAGQAVYLGPVLYAPVTPATAISAAWSIQSWGQVTGGGALDLTNFERHQFKLRLSFSL